MRARERAQKRTAAQSDRSAKEGKVKAKNSLAEDAIPVITAFRTTQPQQAPNQSGRGTKWAASSFQELLLRYTLMLMKELNG